MDNPNFPMDLCYVDMILDASIDQKILDFLVGFPTSKPQVSAANFVLAICEVLFSGSFCFTLQVNSHKAPVYSESGMKGSDPQTALLHHLIPPDIPSVLKVKINFR